MPLPSKPPVCFSLPSSLTGGVGNCYQMLLLQPQQPFCTSPSQYLPAFDSDGVERVLKLVDSSATQLNSSRFQKTTAAPGGLQPVLKPLVRSSLNNLWLCGSKKSCRTRLVLMGADETYFRSVEQREFCIGLFVLLCHHHPGSRPASAPGHACAEQGLP